MQLSQNSRWLEMDIFRHWLKNSSDQSQDSLRAGHVGPASTDTTRSHLAHSHMLLQPACERQAYLPPFPASSAGVRGLNTHRSPSLRVGCSSPGLYNATELQAAPPPLSLSHRVHGLCMSIRLLLHGLLEKQSCSYFSSLPSVMARQMTSAFFLRQRQDNNHTSAYARLNEMHNVFLHAFERNQYFQHIRS